MWKKRFKRAVNTWRRYNRRYGWKWCALNAAAVCLIVAGTIAPIASQMLEAAYYNLSSDALALVGKTDPTLLKQLNYTAADSTYHFNQNTVANASVASLNSLKQQVGTASGHGSDTSLYGLDVPTDFIKGVTYHDINTQLSFTMAPQFSARSGRQVDGHLVFPLSLSTRAIYTLKNNGLKEDIVVNKVTSDTMSFNYTLHLPKTLEAHKLDDGSIGIYSADPSLYGNMKYATPADRAAIQKARETGEKTHLVFGLPAPLVKNAQGQSVGAAHFDLDGSSLRVVATGLDGIKGAFTIDPSVVVTSTSDFQSGNNDGMINFSTSGQVTRDGLTAGSVGTWTATTSLTAAVEQGGSVAYNGYLYQIGGLGFTTAYSAPINSDGTIGAWTSAGSAVGGGNTRNVMVYNGYIYEVGDSPTSGYVYYATIGNGTIGTWTKGTATPATNNAAGVAIYQNYLYLVGGGPSGGGGSYYATVYFAVLNADGSVGSWNTATSLPTATGMNTAIAYNGYLYSIGGANSGGFTQSVYYAPINSDGSIGAWVTTSSITSSKYGQYSYIYDGYIYYAGGWTNTVTYYAPIYANGALGSWQTSTSIISTSGLRYVSGATYNGYIYLLGGREESTSADVATVQYAKIQPPGTLSSYTQTTNVGSVAASKVTANGTVVYGQCIYSFGGYYWNGSAQYVTAVFSASINSDGSLSAWTQSPNNMSYAAGGFGYAVSGNRLYVIGGNNVTGSPIQSTVLNSSGCSTGTWQQDATGYTPGNVGNHSAAAYNGYLYVIGTGAGVSNQVYSAQVNSDGTLGTWTQVSSLNTSRNKESMISEGGYLYVAGGVDSSGSNITSVEYAKITGPGTLGTWTTANSMSVGRSNFALAAHNGYIYALGGAAASSDTASVEYAMINSDGSVGAWQANTSLGSSWKGGGYAVSGNYIYLVCGKNGGVQGDLTYYVTINNGGNGQTSGWQTSSNTFTTARSEQGTFAYNGYLYTIGGISGAAQALSDVQYAKINTNGTLGTWQTTTSLPGARVNFGLAEYNGYVYVLGGTDVNSADQQTTLYAKVNADGTLGTWQTGMSFSGARSSLGATAYAGYLYILGGDGDSDVQYATINSDGSIGAWQTTTSLPTLMGNFGTIAYDGYVYTLGGAQYVSDPRGGYSETSLSTVQYAKINSDGTVGSWQATTGLGTARDSLNAVVYDGYLYALGGEDISVPVDYNLVQCAAINANGSIGGWQTTNSFTTARHNASAAVYGGYVYLQGGVNGSTAEGDTQYGSLNIIPRVGYYSKLVDLGSAQTVTSITYNGTLPLTSGMIPVTYRAAGTNGIFGAASPLSGIGAGITARYLLVSFTFDDSQTAVFPDISSTPATLTDFTVNYVGSSGHPSPAQRLRQGQTLQGGVLSPFDTISP